MTMFYCQCHDFKVGQVLELTRWWMDSGMGNVNVFSSVDITGCIILKRFFLEAFCNQTIGHIYNLWWFLYGQLHYILILIYLCLLLTKTFKGTQMIQIRKKKIIFSTSKPLFFILIFQKKKNVFHHKSTQNRIFWKKIKIFSKIFWSIDNLWR